MKKEKTKAEVVKEITKAAEITPTINGRFIFNENEIVNPVVFSCHKVGNDYGFGLMLPKEVPLYSGRGKNVKVLGSHQIRAPAVVTSGPDLIEPTLETEKKHKIKYVAIPTDLKLRFEVSAIRQFLDGKAEIVDGKEIFESIKETYKELMFFQSGIWYCIHPIWDIGTYFFELFNCFPLLELHGLSGTAKSKIMGISRFFTLNPTEIMINPSEASLFRVTHTKRPTKYIDEAEKLFVYINGQWQSSPIVELINGSYTKGSAVPRLEKVGRDYKVVYFQCYSPTMIGSIAGLRGATETRAITHITTKAPPNDARGQLDEKDYENNPKYQQIRNKLYLFALQNWKRIETTNKELKIDDLKMRDFQLWRPLLSVAKVIDEKIYDDVLKFAKQQATQKQQDFIHDTSLDYKILKIVKEKIGNETAKIRPKDICQEINANASLEFRTAEKTISSHLDSFGFKEYRKRDAVGSYFDLTEPLFQEVVMPICAKLWE